MRNENFSAELRIKEETLLAKNPKKKQLCKESEEETTQEIKGLQYCNQKFVLVSNYFRNRTQLLQRKLEHQRPET